MTTLANRLAAAAAAQSEWDAYQADAPARAAEAKAAAEAAAAEKIAFNTVRAQVHSVASHVGSHLPSSLTLKAWNNDAYWPRGGVNLTLEGSKQAIGGAVWLADDDQVWAGGNPYTGDVGQLLGDVTGIDERLLQDYLVDMVERGTGVTPAT